MMSEITDNEKFLNIAWRDMSILNVSASDSLLKYKKVSKPFSFIMKSFPSFKLYL